MDGVSLYARSRFITVLCLTIAGVTLAVGAFVLTPSAERWLGVGVGAGCLALTLIGFATAGRGTVQRVLDIIMVPICAWAVASALTLEQSAAGPIPHLVRWLGFSAGAAVAVIGLVGLVAHELGIEADLRYATERIWGLTPRSVSERADDYVLER